MSTKYIRLAAAFVLASAPCGVSAQGLDSLGTRAAAMAAFVAVADDATAVIWNPAGLVTGPFFNIVIDFGRTAQRATPMPEPGSESARGRATLVALGTTPVGLAYYRLSSTAVDVSSPAVLGSPDRQDHQVVVRTLVTSHLGATVQQSIGSNLTLGATLKLVRGSVGTARRTVASWDEAFAFADGVEATASTRGDLDIGAMASAGRMRVGLVVRNLTEPTFGDDGPAVAALRRHGRLGVAWGDRWSGTPTTVVALDADLAHVPGVGGDRRDVSAGVERWLRNRQLGVRGGVRASTIGDPRAVLSGGVSYAMRPGMYVDAFVARGDRHARAWGLAARVTY